jgi:capsular polysaccharide biosynthesis protein
MELRTYGKILRRRWWLALVPALVVLAVGLLTYRRPAPAYNVGVRFLVGQPPTAAAELEDEERLANWQTSEYVVNGLTDWISGLRFAERVSARLAEQGVTAPAGAIRGGLAVDNTRSMLQLSLTYGDSIVLEQMVEAAIAVIVEENGTVIPQLGGEPAAVQLLDAPVVNEVPPGLRSQLDLALRLVIAVGAGIGLAFLVEYLDPALQERRDLEQLALPVLGEIPKE